MVKVALLCCCGAEFSTTTQKACEPGLGKTELQRLDVIANLYKAYADGLERYVGYRKIEEKLVEMEKKYAELARKAQAQSI